MIQVFIVSLHDSVDRRNTITKYLNNLEIPFEFVDAIDARNGLPIEYENQVDRVETARRGRMVSDAEFACSLTHVKIYRKIVDEKIPWALIFEDDAIPHSDLVQYLKNRHYEDSQFTELGTYFPLYVRKKGQKNVFGKYKSYLPAIGNSPAGAFGYVLSNKSAQFILDNGVPVTNRPDWPYCVGKIIINKEFRIIYPSLVHHPKGTTQSQVEPYRQEVKKHRRRFWGIYIPPKRAIVDSFIRSYFKLFAIKINDH